VHRNIGTSVLIPKNHFISLEIFREEPLVSWNWTDAVLFTAYDVFRNRDFWIDSVINSGMTIKDSIVAKGFPRDVRIMVDTGIFEIEAKKAGISQELGIDVDIQLSIEEVMWIYRLSGADYFVIPDEIILPSDSKEVAITKIETMKTNLHTFLNEFPPEKLVAVLQGLNSEMITNLFDYYRENGITFFAAGGIIPLWKYNREKFEERLFYLRELTKDYWLHIFGLPSLSLIPVYSRKYEANSIDTSLLIYLTAKRKYVVGNSTIQIRLANFSECPCEGCQKLRHIPGSRSTDFFVNLYIHNVIEANSICRGIPTVVDDLRVMKDTFKQNFTESKKHNVEKINRGWRTARGDSL